MKAAHEKLETRVATSEHRLDGHAKRITAAQESANTAMFLSRQVRDDYL
jgi:hypothetical protein